MQPSRFNFIRFLLIVCLAADAYLFTTPLILGPTGQAVTIAIMFGQVSLATLVSCIESKNQIFKLLIPCASVVLSWFVMTRVFSWGVNDPVSAGWAFALTTQALLIAIWFYAIPFVLSFVSFHQQKSANDKTEPPPRANFSLMTMLIWTAIVAGCFTFVQYGRNRWGWSDRIIAWEHLAGMPMIGGLGAVFAIAWLWVWNSQSIESFSLRTVFAASAIAGFTMIAPCGYFLATKSNDFDHHTANLFALVQSLMLIVFFAGMRIDRRGFPAQAVPETMKLSRTKDGVAKGPH